MAGLSFKKIARSLKDNMAIVLQLAAVIFIGLSILFGRSSDYTDTAARDLSSRLSSRVKLLETYMEQALKGTDSPWMELEDLPQDMVIYRYMGDTLQSWCHQFPVNDDEIDTRSLFRLAPSLSNTWYMPLADIGKELSFRNIGPKWYLAKFAEEGKVRVVAGLEVKNTINTPSVNGVNPVLRLSDRFSVYPLSYSGGAEVSVDGQPLMKVIQENAQVPPLVPNVLIVWIALLIMIIAAFVYLFTHRTIKGMLITQVWLILVLGAFYILGRWLSGTESIFSPAVYADGSVFYSLGAVLLINLAISLLVYTVYCVRLPLTRAINRSKARMILPAVPILALAAILIYSYISFKSIIVNSVICLELYKIAELSSFTVYVYISYIFLISACVMLLQLLRPWFKYVFGLRVNFLSHTGRMVIMIVCAAALVTFSSIEGKKREERRVNIWANRLAVERNLAFELQLMGVENAIASDAVMANLVLQNADYRIILNRITEGFLGRMSQEYELGLFIFNDKDGDAAVMSYLSDLFSKGSPIADDSRFIYTRSANGMARYAGQFTYYSPSTGMTRMVVTIDAKTDNDDIGYYAILENSSPGNVILPHTYSYAKYLNGKLVSYKGNYAYPTVLKDRFKEVSATSQASSLNYDDYEHFFKKVSDGEFIVISRPEVEFTNYLVASFMVALAMLFILSMVSMDRKRRSAFTKNYYKSTFNTILFVSLVGTMVVLALISVFFVYRRNEANINNLMTSKISTIQALVQSEIRYYTSYEDFDTQQAGQMLTAIGDHTQSDLTLYTADGRVFKSTRPEVFERLLWGMRADEDAYRNIMYENKRYYIHKERTSGRQYYAMYAPLSNGDGKVLAILCAPYTDTGLEFRTEAVFHSLFIITLFFILLSVARLISTRIIDKMFIPILEMGRKMTSARDEGLEYIIYEREDEISSLVRAYNLMVHDLSESSRQLARAERDKAWSEMARQVAHEIKNPLTPIKLQIQRLIMLRSRGDASWGERFDSMAPVILESIDTLTDTANEFSTFAKLYSEEPVTIDLDRLIAEQIALFDGRSNIEFQYIGLQGAVIEGPKPQITRVFVNLLTNAVQAVENSVKEQEEKGEEPAAAKVYVSLRKSTRDGFYDVVVEDNGPGVKDENRARLFTPNFTTKSSGTGLGLAICKNILERCGGEIFYSRSFTLGGACFTVRLPLKG
ncbi:MAG: cache domain-containing protein [Bacteroidales bacterium]|nr:cache domain-containing protein [Bacteroidales bacterium]